MCYENDVYALIFFVCKDKFLPLRTFFLPFGPNLLFLNM